MTHILSCRRGSLYCDTERLTMAYLEGPQAQWGACQPTPDPGGFDHNVCIIMGSGMYVGTSSCPIHCTESIAGCVCVLMEEEGRGGGVFSSKDWKGRRILFAMLNGASVIFIVLACAYVGISARARVCVCVRACVCVCCTNQNPAGVRRGHAHTY